MTETVNATRRNFGIATLGGPTAVIDYGETRFLTDPTFDASGAWGVISKTEPAAIPAAALGTIDVVLLSHGDHKDNLDDAGYEVTLRVSTVITNPTSAVRFPDNAIVVAAGESVEVTRRDGRGRIKVTAVDAIHGPLDGDRDDGGHVTTEVIGFVLESAGLPTVYVSGDNASILPIAEAHRDFPHIDYAVLHMGAARNPLRSGGRTLTLTADRAADAALLLGVPTVIPVHFRGWSIYSQNEQDIRTAFEDAGISECLVISQPGAWAKTI